MDITTLSRQYASGATTPAQIVNAIYDRIDHEGTHPIWISLVPREQALARAEALANAEDKTKLTLFGIPFAIKDNIDVAGIPTTAACPAFSHIPTESATVVTLLEQAGAILIGKTNLDQFATGLNGTRSPYGKPSSVFGTDMISGGSSAGSSVAVANGTVSFSLGTDTAGSGRVPAMLNNLIGLKPTRGLVSTKGVLPACRTLDCVSVFAETASDAAKVLGVLGQYDPADDYSRKPIDGQGAAPWSSCVQGSPVLRVGVLKPADRNFFGDTLNPAMYSQTIDAVAKGIGGHTVSIVEVDIAPFLATAALLYQGPWVAERYAAIAEFYDKHSAEMDPSVTKIVGGAKNYSAAQAFEAAYKLEALRRETQKTWAQVDVLLLPTAPRTFTHAEMAEQPIERNSILGTYTNFVNLLDLAAVAVPAGMRTDGLPFGVTLVSHAFTDPALLLLADALHRELNTTLGGSDRLLSATPKIPLPANPHGCQLMTVVGAHLSGMPLNWQLTQRDARLVRTCRTHPDYRFYALKGTVPPKPGLVWEPGFEGKGIEVEVWALPLATGGSFLEGIPSPLGLGTLRLEDGTQVKGFLCEPAGLEGATEITSLGGWRAYIRSLTAK